MTSAAIVAAAPTVLASSGTPTAPTESTFIPADGSVKRYMAASALMPGGRILVTGGFDQKWSENSPPKARNSAMILDANTGQWTQVASMNVPRARHASVALRDGRVAVIGGVGKAPLSSIEVYDPKTNTWQFAEALAQPRYDHTAVSDGVNIVVIGGSGQSMLSSVEMMQIESTFNANP